MKITNITIKNEGYVYCKSRFYSSQDSLSNLACYSFLRGLNKLTGEIDSGNWAISYLLSMYQYRPEDFVLFNQPNVVVNNKSISLNEFSEFACYMDELDPLFSTSNSVKEIIRHGLMILNFYFKWIVNDLNGLLMLLEMSILKQCQLLGFLIRRKIFVFRG